MFDPINARRRSTFIARRSLVLAPHPPWPSWLGGLGLLLILLGGLGALVGCNGDHLLRPEGPRGEPMDPAPGTAIELTLVFDERSGVPARELGQLTSPAEVAAALRALPLADREELRVHGVCVTQDPTFRAVVRDLLGLGSNVRGVAGHIDDSSWGRIKVHFRA